MPNSKEKLFTSFSEPLSDIKSMVEVLPAVIKASQDLQENIQVTTFGLTRLTTVAAYCLVAGESPKKLYQEGSLQAVLAIWGWGLWLNDFFDKDPYPDSGSSRPLTKLENAKIKKNGDQILLVDEARLIVSHLSKGIKETADETIKTMIREVAQVESHRPDLKTSPSQEIFNFRFQVNQAYALPLIKLLSFPKENPSERLLRTLIPFMEAVCLVDDVVGVPEDLRKGLPTYGTWALKEAGDYQQAIRCLRREREKRVHDRKREYPTGWRFLKQFPETKELLRRTFIALMTAAPDQVLDKFFRAGAYALWEIYPPLYQGLLQDLMGHNSAKGRQKFV